LVVNVNGGEVQQEVTDGAFTFGPFDAGLFYSVTVGPQSTGLNCKVAYGNGTVTANVTNVQVTCTP
jgi:hypothetical protein